VFADPATWPNNLAEKTEYDLHENDVTDTGYNAFLARIVEPLCSRLAPCSQILDFGCGPAPALAQQLTSMGHKVSLYDVFYHHEPSVLQTGYDAIVMTEVIEHLHSPHMELLNLWRLLKQGGVLGIMTQRVIDIERFKTWQYKNDPTHVCFYSEATFDWVAQWLKAEQIEFEGRDMVFITKGRLT
jgi:2-polyprenyl-3-methyl-5-hydroxy-6-metoxy-1,4-benzoquinol methylase